MMTASLSNAPWCLDRLRELPSGFPHSQAAGKFIAIKAELQGNWVCNRLNSPMISWDCSIASLLAGSIAGLSHPSSP